MVPAVRLMLCDPVGAEMFPAPHAPARLFGVDTTNPEGKLSTNATPVRLVAVFGLVIVKLSAVDAPRAIVDAPNAFVMAGGLATIRFADAVLPVPPLVELTVPVIFVYCPRAVAVTFTMTVQDVLGGVIFPPARLMPVDPANAATEPLQVFAIPFGVATTSPVGSVSVKESPESPAMFAVGFDTLSVSVVTPFNDIAAGLNSLAIAGGAITSMLAEAAPPVPPSLEVILFVELF
jgi:hypothetical protein